MNELFFNTVKLPNTLSYEEMMILFQEMKLGREDAFRKLVVHNIKLVLFEIRVRFKNVLLDREDLISVGNIGLIKAVYTFDLERNVKFSVYAVRCIDREILMFLNKKKKVREIDSLERVIFCDNDGNELRLMDVIGDDVDIMDEYEEKEFYQHIHQIVEKLSSRDRAMIILYFGFFGYEVHTKTEIARMMNISPSYASRRINFLVQKIGEQLKMQYGYFDDYSRRMQLKERKKLRKISR